MTATALKIKTVSTIPTVTDLLGVRYNGPMQESFPDVDPGITPFGYLILLQLRTPKKITKGGIIVPDESQDAERYRVQTGLVRALGPSCFKRRDTGEDWHERAWCEEGDFVRTVMYGGDRWIVPYGDKQKGDHAVFLICKDTDLIGLVTGDPLGIITS